MTELLVGDPALGLMLGEFLKGEPIATVVTGKIYAIEFLDINMRPLQDEHPIPPSCRKYSRRSQ
jgi:hypothetical protein